MNVRALAKQEGVLVQLLEELDVAELSTCQVAYSIRQELRGIESSLRELREKEAACR
jgi:hypothetical protein